MYSNTTCKFNGTNEGLKHFLTSNSSEFLSKCNCYYIIVLSNYNDGKIDEVKNLIDHNYMFMASGNVLYAFVLYIIVGQIRGLVFSKARIWRSCAVTHTGLIHILVCSHYMFYSRNFVVNLCN